MKKYQHNKRKQCYVSLNKINLTKNYSSKINLRRIEDESHIVDGKNITLENFINLRTPELMRGEPTRSTTKSL